MSVPVQVALDVKRRYPRIDGLREQIVAEEQAGVRLSLREPLIRESLDATKGEPWPIRRARGFIHILERADLPLYEGDLIAGSLFGIFPLHEEQYTAEQVYQESKAHIDSLFADGGFEAGAFDTTRKLLRLQYEYEGPRVPYDYLVSAAKRLAKKRGDAPGFEEIFAALQRHFCKAPQAIQLLRAAVADGSAETANEGDPVWTMAHHIAVDYERVLRQGFGGLKDIAEKGALEADDADSELFYRAVVICMDGVIVFARRYAAAARDKAQFQPDAESRRELETVARIMEAVSFGGAGSFREAIQLFWLAYLLLCMAGGTAIAAGRFDQFMYPYYKADLAAGRITRDEAFELLACLWLRINESVNVPVQNFTIGGMTPDGDDGTNDLTFLCLDVAEYLQVPYPNISLRTFRGSDAGIYTRAIEVASTGLALPAIWNDEVLIDGLSAAGFETRDARDYVVMGCIEVVLPGSQPPFENGGSINLAELLTRTITAQAEKGEGSDFPTFLAAFQNVLKERVDAEVQRIDSRYRLLHRVGTDPFGSALVRDCLEKGRDMYQSGARFRAMSGIWCMGLATVADSLAAMKRLVYDEERIGLSELAKIIEMNFEGHEPLRLELLHAMPKYGNDDPAVDDLARKVAGDACRLILSHNRGEAPGIYLPILGSYVGHISGGLCGATPDGRRSGEPLSDAASPAQGRDRKGPTAVVRSVTGVDYTLAPGGVGMNLKFHSSVADSEEGRNALVAMMKTYLQSGGQQITFNVVGAEALRGAIDQPELYQDLVVRVAGFNEYFVKLDPALQREIAERTAHEVG